MAMKVYTEPEVRSLVKELMASKTWQGSAKELRSRKRFLYYRMIDRLPLELVITGPAYEQYNHGNSSFEPSLAELAGLSVVMYGMIVLEAGELDLALELRCNRAHYRCRLSQVALVAP